MHRTALGIVIDFAELSDPGLDPSKQVNEDASGYAETPLGHLLVLCDGMGGHVAGREASELAVREITTRVNATPAETAPSEALARAITEAGRAVYDLGADAPSASRPGATCVAALIHPDGLYLAHVGDSRGYLLRKGHITQLTRDHSVVQEMVAAGLIAPEDAASHPDANQITRALGIVAEPEVESTGPLALFPGDTLLLASDGLTDLVTDAELLLNTSRWLASGPAVVCQQLVDQANQRGGHDNITVQLVELIEVPPSAGPKTALLEGVPQALAAAPIPAKTLIGETVELPAQRSGATQLLSTIAPTMSDAVPPTERAPATLIDPPALEPGAHAGEPGSRAGAAGPRFGKHLVAIAGSVAVVIVLGVVVWWVAGVRARRATPQPEPALLEPAQDGGVLELKPATEPSMIEPPSTEPKPTPDDAAAEPSSAPPHRGWPRSRRRHEPVERP